MRPELWTNVRMLVCAVQNQDTESTPHMLAYSTFLIEAGELIGQRKITCQRAQTMPLDFARSQLAQAAGNPENGFTHMYMYDCDMEFTLAKVEKLLSRNVDIVSGTYFMAGWQDRDGGVSYPFPCVAQRKGNYITRLEIADAGERDELIEVDGIGGGSLLVRTQVLRDMGPETFRFNWNITNTGATREGEDYYFARMARASGYRVYMDPTVLHDHFKLMRVGLVLRDMNGKKITTFDQ
jgi:hypothetical protein